jgi:hypothetical protein
MVEVRERISLPAGDAYNIFCDGARLHWWVPGLRRATVLAIDDDDRPLDVRFEFAVNRVYVLRYGYDPSRLSVSWRPIEGKLHAVSGEALFLAEAGGSILVYREESVGEARSAAERRAFSAADVARAFARYASGAEL